MKRILALVLCAVILATPVNAALETRVLRLEQAQRMALSISKDISRQNNKIILQRMKYVEAVEGIRAKVKNLRSFRWSPLLSFKFPQQLDLTQEYDLNIKPLTLQTEIDNMTHKLADLEYQIIYEVNSAYHDVYLLQESSAFTQERLNDAETQLTRNRAKLASGKATQTSVDRAQSSVDTLTRELANQLRDFQTAKERLSELIGMDVTTGYRFLNGFKTAAIPRERLEDLIQYTLDHDQTFYETKAAASVALLNIESYESLMRNEYGSKMNYIQVYINMAKQGMDVDYGAFQLKYREMLTALDKPWSGKLRILFFTFTMEWFKGEIDGTRYIEDEMYAVYTACMEYANAKREQDAMERELRAQVRDTYESLVTSWNSFETLQKLSADAQRTLEKILVLNQLGKASYEETADAQTDYQNAQQDTIDALKDYNDLLSEFDRLTCGAIAKYLRDSGMDLNAGEGGDAYALLDPIHDPYYYIYSSVADLTFYIGVSIPDGFAPAVDSFEVWYDGTQIGTRTATGEELRHLTLDYRDTNRLTLRLYNGDSFVTECGIDASIPRDTLDIQPEKPPPETRIVGSYAVSTTTQGGVSVSELKLRLNAVENASAYTLTYENQGIYTTERRPLTESFTYLTLLIASLENVTASLYDSEGGHVMDVHFDTATQELFTDVNPA